MFELFLRVDVNMVYEVVMKFMVLWEHLMICVVGSFIVGSLIGKMLEK